MVEPMEATSTPERAPVASTTLAAKSASTPPAISSAPASSPPASARPTAATSRARSTAVSSAAMPVPLPVSTTSPRTVPAAWTCSRRHAEFRYTAGMQARGAFGRPFPFPQPHFATRHPPACSSPAGVGGHGQRKTPLVSSAFVAVAVAVVVPPAVAPAGPLPYSTLTVRRLALAALGRVSSSTPLSKLALAASVSTSAGRATVRENSPRLISQR